MKNTVELTCINCPIGCSLKATLENGIVVNVEGNGCPRGKKYAESEVTAPKRTVTSVVESCGKFIPVKTVPEIPKEKIFDVMDAIHGISLDYPVKIGTVILRNVAGTGSDLIACSDTEDC